MAWCRSRGVAFAMLFFPEGAAGPGALTQRADCAMCGMAKPRLTLFPIASSVSQLRI
jgi:hypothetical protein